MTTESEQSEKHHTRAVVCALSGATLFGFLGIFTRFLSEDKGIPSFDVATLRLVFATVTLLVVLLLTERAELRVKLGDIPFLALFGLFKFLSDGTLFYAMDSIELSLATLLQMTAPYYVMILSLVMFKERITRQKLIAVMMTFTGCLMVTGAFLGGDSLEVWGILSAALSGLFFALYLMGNRFAADRGLHPVTALFYFFLFGLISSVVFSACFSDLPHTISRLVEPDVLGAAVFLGVALTLIPFYLYAYAATNSSTTLVSMISVAELVVAAIVGFVFFDEVLTPLNIVGICLVLGSIVVADLHLSVKVRKRRAEIAAAGGYVRK